MAALEPHSAVFLRGERPHQWDQYQERAALPVRTQCCRKFANSLPGSGQSLSHYRTVIKEPDVSALPPPQRLRGGGGGIYREGWGGGWGGVNLKFNQPPSAAASSSAVFVFALDVFAKTSSINISIQTVPCTTGGIATPPSPSHPHTL